MSAIVLVGEHFPAKCSRTDSHGNLPTCTKHVGGEWEVSYPSGPDGGLGGGFALLFVLALVVGIGFTIWKVSTAQRMARDSGMNVGDATAMTLLSDDGFEATYLASNLRGQSAPAAAPTPATRTTEQRLRELDDLRAGGLVTEGEYAARRTAILEEL